MRTLHQNLVPFLLLKFEVDQQVNRDVCILKHLKEPALGAVTDRRELGSDHFNSGIGVEEDALLDSLDGLVAELAVEEGIFPRVFDLSGLTIEVLDLHLVLGQGGGLAAAQLLDRSHLLRGIQISDKN